MGSAAGQLILRGLVQIGTELGEGLQLAERGQVELQRTGNLLHLLDLRRAADSGHGNAYVDCRALTLEEQVGLQVDLTVGDGNDVRRDVGGDVAGLGLDDRQSRHGTETVLLVHLHSTPQQARMQVEVSPG